MNNIENRIKCLENRHALPPTLQEKMEAFRRSCDGLPDNVVAERKRLLLFRLSKSELLQIARLPPNATIKQIEAVAAGATPEEVLNSVKPEPSQG